jgi:hypothetical protein
MAAKLPGVAFAAFALLTTPAFAGWQDQASQADQQRLSRLDEARQRGLSEAQSGGDMGAIQEALGPPSRGASAGEFAGTWRCRQMKLCRISNRGGHLFFEKVNGSQRTQGWLYPDGGTFVYLGAQSARNEPPHAYSGSSPSLGASQTPDDQIGRLSMIGSGHARLEIPFPIQESTFDVIELRR